MAETVTVDGLEIPVGDIGHSDLREWVGDVPDGFDVDRVYRWDGRLVGDLRRGDRVIEVHYQEDEASGEISLEAHEITTPSSVDEAEEVLWTRPDRAGRELAALVDLGLSPAEALDYWMVEQGDQTATEWSEQRGTSHQAVSENVRKARNKLD